MYDQLNVEERLASSGLMREITEPEWDMIMRFFWHIEKKYRGYHK